MAATSQIQTNSIAIVNAAGETVYLMVIDGQLRILTPSQAAQYSAIAPGIGAQPSSQLTADPDFQDYISPASVSTFISGSPLSASRANVTTLTRADASGSNAAGTDVTIQGGPSTGTGNGGDVLITTTPRTSTGSTVNTAVTRLGVPGTRLAATSTVASTVATFSLAAGAGIGGEIFYSIIASDGTDHQIRCAHATFGIVNKAGVATSDTDIGTTSIAASTGTLTATLTWDVSTVTSPLLQVTPTTSLTATTFFIDFVIVNCSDRTMTLP